MAFYPFAKWLGGPKSYVDKVTKETKTLRSFTTPMTDSPKGLVLHISDGALEEDGKIKVGGLGGPSGGAGGLLTTFITTGSVTHFGIDLDGNIGQYIDTKFRESGTENGAKWFSVEFCQYQGLPATPPKL